MGKTLIAWTDVTDNIITVKGGGWWCRKISDGCRNCYAAKLNQSDYFGGNKLPYSGDAPELELKTDIIESWARMRTQKKHFVASMTDVFGEWLPDNWITAMLDGMAAAPLQIFQVLTKRSANMKRIVNEWTATGRGIPSNIWFGVSVENRKEKKRLDDLKETKAAVRWVSYEPALEQVFFDSHDDMLDWIVVGGESGPGARRFELDWAKSTIQTGSMAGIPIFVKQIGKVLAKEYGLTHPKGGDINEWPFSIQVREFPKN